MTQSGQPARLVMFTLAAVAGYVDAVGFVVTGGFFVSFMSGNTTRLGLATAQVSNGAAIAATAVAAFVSGVVLGSLVGRTFKGRRATAVLAIVATVLSLATIFLSLGIRAVAVPSLAFAMGVQNVVFVEKGDVRVGLTYMTGNLVKVGKRIADALTGGPALAWIPHLSLWASMLGGAILGATLQQRFGPWALAAAPATVACLLAGSVARLF